MTTLVRRTPRTMCEEIAPVIAAAFPTPLWITGEIQSISHVGAHIFCTLRDGDAVMQVVALGKDGVRIRARLRAAGLVLTAGQTASFYGMVAIYARRGSIQINASDIDDAIGVGRLELERRRIRQILSQSDYARFQRSMPTPSVPLRLAVISPGGQGYRDFYHRLAATDWAIEIVHTEVKSAGDVAATQIASAISSHTNGFDLIVLTRGGGDGVTTAYDAENVVAAIVQCPIPVLVAVGHDDDHPLAELVAWQYVATPTAAAVSVDGIFRSISDALDTSWAQTIATARSAIAKRQMELDAGLQLLSSTLLTRQAMSASVAPETENVVQPSASVRKWIIAVVIIIIILALIAALVLGGV